MSRQVPHLCKVAPSTQKYHMEDVHRAGGVVGILGELNRAGLLHNQSKTVLGLTWEEQLAKYDIMLTDSEEVKSFYRAGLRVSAPHKHSRKIVAGILSMTTVRKAVSAPKKTPSAKMAALPF